MTETIKLTAKHTVLKSAVVGIQYEEPADFSKFGIFLEEDDEVKVLLIGGNSIKYRVPKGQGVTEKARIEQELGW